MKYIRKTPYDGNQVKRVDYDFALYIPIYNFKFGRVLACDAFGCRYVKKVRSFAIEIRLYEIKYILRKLRRLGKKAGIF